jgi:hypothetical protein
MRNSFKTFAGKPEGKRPVGRPRRRWEDNTKMDRKEIVSEYVHVCRNHLSIGTGGGLVSSVMNLWVI